MCSTPQEMQVTTSTGAWSLAQVAHINVIVWACLCACALKPIALRTWTVVAGMDGVMSSLGKVYRMQKQGATMTPQNQRC